jgi:hypothetical protein
MPATSYRSGDVTAISPGFHGRSLLTRPLGQLTRQILLVAGAAAVGSMALNLARGDTVMTVVTPPLPCLGSCSARPRSKQRHS